MKKTDFYNWHQARKARLIEFGGWLMPVYYTSIIEEYWAVRKESGVFDISHMGEIEVTGPEALLFLQYVLTNDLSDVLQQQCRYSPMCTENGGIIDDLIVYKISNHKFLLVVNASNCDSDFAHLVAQKDNFQVELKNISDSISSISWQGPASRKLLQNITDVDLGQLDYFYFKPAKLAGIPVIISRTGYTGELGYEIFYFKNGTADQSAGKIWQNIIEKGAIPCGLGARDILRLEMKYPLYGNDIDGSTNPLEAGLGWAVKLAKADFIGRGSLTKIKNQGISRKLVGLEMEGRQVSRHSFPIFNDSGREIGRVTSGTFSPTLNKSIALGYVTNLEARIGNAVQVEIRGAKCPARLVRTPFVDSHVRD